jgi:hypothetical protein
MIETTTINGRPATVAYLNDQMKLVNQDSATLVKATFLDEANGVAFLVPVKDIKAKAFSRKRAHARLVLRQGEFREEEHPRGQPGNPGQFTTGGAPESEDAPRQPKKPEEAAAPRPPPPPPTPTAVAAVHPTVQAISDQAGFPADRIDYVGGTDVLSQASTQTGRISVAADAIASAGAQPNISLPPAPKKKSGYGEFSDAGIRLSEAGGATKFLERWNDVVDTAPAEFKKTFLGGMPGTMNIRFDERADSVSINGSLQDERGNTIAEYSRDIDFDDKYAYSAYFKVRSSEQGGDIGKRLLAANVAMYEKLGLEKVKVTANIDVGGYAWARYGYVPTASAWDQLSGQIEHRIDQMTGRAERGRRATGDTYSPESWDMIGESDREHIQSRWMRDTHEEFLESEIESWRDSGAPLNEAKLALALNFDRHADWAKDAVQDWREQFSSTGPDEYDENKVPFTNEQILAAIEIDYSSRYDDGREDPDISFDDEKLSEPKGYEPTQATLPGIEPIEPHEYLTEEMRDGIEEALTKAFNAKAESDAGDVEPPDFSDSVAEFQNEHWESMEDDAKYDWASRNDELPEYEIEEEEEEEEFEPEGEVEDDTAGALRKLAESSDPKAIWRIADSPHGKDLLLNTHWSGVIDLKDKETMDRFRAYVSKRK